METPAQFEVDVPIPAFPKQRPRFSRYGGTYTPPETEIFEQNLRMLVSTKYRIAGHREPLAGALALKIIFRVPKPPSIELARRPYPCVRPDLDNLLKGVQDALNGVLWKDDGQIVEVEMSKVYGDGSIFLKVRHK